VLIDALGQPALLGTVKRIAPIAQTGSQVTSYEVVLEIEPGTRLVKSGMTASATIVTDRRDNALRVPTAAIRTENGASVVTVVTTAADGKQQMATRTVQVGPAFGDQTEITNGLNEGELVQISVAK
jgi:HlyD family secretion protein